MRQNQNRNQNQLVPSSNQRGQGQDLMSFGMDNDPFFAGFGNMHNQMMSNFQSMSTAMMGSSPFGQDFFSSSMFPSAFRDEDIFGFSNMHEKMNNFQSRNGQGTLTNGNGGNNGQFQVFSSSMVQRQVMGEDGKPKIEKYYTDNRVHRGNDGNTVSEGKQAYHNQANGRSIVAHERMLNDKGHKTVKERNKQGEIHDQNLYNNIREEDAQDFHNKWNQQSRNLQSIQGAQGNQRMMQLQQQDNQRNRQQEQQQQQLSIQPEYPAARSTNNAYQNQQQQQQQQYRSGYESPAMSVASHTSSRSGISNGSTQRNPMASNVRGFQEMNARNGKR